MTTDPIMALPGEAIVASGADFAVREWRHGPGGGPPLHVHHRGDEAWFVLEGTLRFRFADQVFDADAGAGVFVPAGVPHTFGNPGPGDVRYLIMLSNHVLELIDALHSGGISTSDDYASLFRKYDSELLEPWPV